MQFPAQPLDDEIPGDSLLSGLLLSLGDDNSDGELLSLGDDDSDGELLSLGDDDSDGELLSLGDDDSDGLLLSLGLLDSDGELDSLGLLLDSFSAFSIHQRIPRRVGTGHTLTGEPSGRYSVLSSAFQIRATTY
jgi:hypothetical protein